MKTKLAGFSHAIQSFKEATIVFFAIVRFMGYLIVEEPILFLKGVSRIALNALRTTMKIPTTS